MNNSVLASVLSAWVLLTTTACGQSIAVPMEVCTSTKPAAIEDHARHNRQQYAARVEKVSDGDTIQVRNQHGRRIKIRLAFIDAPELNQAGGQDSRRQLDKLLLGQSVLVQVTDVDRYQRQVALIRLGGQDVNATQILTGMAWHYQSIGRRQQTPKSYQYYRCLEQTAQQGRIGLWRGKHIEAPWQYRQQQRQ